MNSKEKVEKIINGIYAKYAPLKSGEVANLLRKYEGQEDELLKRICKKYGVQASDLDAFEEGVRITYRIWKLKEIEKNDC